MKREVSRRNKRRACFRIKAKIGEGSGQGEMGREDTGGGVESRRTGDKKGGEDWRIWRMRWDRNGEEKKRQGREKQSRGEEETVGLVRGWNGRREGTSIREGRGDKNEFLFHPEWNNPQKLQR